MNAELTIPVVVTPIVSIPLDLITVSANLDFMLPYLLEIIYKMEAAAKVFISILNE